MCRGVQCGVALALLLIAGCGKEAPPPPVGGAVDPLPPPEKLDGLEVMALRLEMLSVAAGQYGDVHAKPVPPGGPTWGGNAKAFSWRVLLLPYLEYDDLYQRMSVGMPAAEYGPKMPTGYAPAGSSAPKNGMAHLRRVVGKGPRWEKAFVVVMSENGVPWAEPGDEVAIESVKPAHLIGSPNEFLALCADGKVRLIPKSLDAKAVEAALLDGTGGTPVDLKAIKEKQRRVK